MINGFPLYIAKIEFTLHVSLLYGFWWWEIWTDSETESEAKDSDDSDWEKCQPMPKRIKKSETMMVEMDL